MKSCDVIVLLVLTLLLICIRNVVGPKNKGKAKQEWRSLADFATAGEIEMASGPSSRPPALVTSSNGGRTPIGENYQKDYKCLYEHYFPFLRILETYKTYFPGINNLPITRTWWPTKEMSDLYAKKKSENIAVGQEYEAYRAMGTAISTAYSHLMTVTFVTPNRESAMFFEAYRSTNTLNRGLARVTKLVITYQPLIFRIRIIKSIAVANGNELFKLCNSIQTDRNCSTNYKDTMLLRRTLAMSYKRLRGTNNFQKKFSVKCPTADVTSADEGMR